jgi:uridine kinase
MQHPERITDLDALLGWVHSKSRPDHPAIIGVCGYPGAGKTTLCKALTAAPGNRIVHFDCDRFSRLSFTERETHIAEALITDTPDDAAENPLNWYAWEAIEAALHGIRIKGRFTYPHGWNRKTGELDEDYSITLPENEPALLLCDCIYLLHPPVRDWLDAVILVDTPLNVTLARGQARSKDPARAAYMERLTRTYTVPYFATHMAAADLIFADQAALPER